MSQVRLVSLLFAGILSGFFSSKAQAQITPSHLVDVVYDWPSPYPSGDGALQTTFTVWDDPGINTYYYFAHFFSMGPYTGDANNTTVYFGLQTNGDANRSAIFSVWNASGALGPNCSTFGNEGIGWHCLINYPWEAGHSYVITTQRTAGVMVDTWSASVNDIDAGVSTPIGQIFGQHTDQRPSTSWFFYEYYQTVPSCDSLPRVRMTFSDTVGENGSVMPKFDPGYYGQNFYEGPCSANIKTMVCGNTVYNDAGGAFARAAGDNGVDPNTGCRAPPTRFLPTAPTPVAAPSSSASPAPTDANAVMSAAGNANNTPSDGNTLSIAPPVDVPTSTSPSAGTANPTSSQRGFYDETTTNSHYAGCASTKQNGSTGVILFVLLVMRGRSRRTRNKAHHSKSPAVL